MLCREHASAQEKHPSSVNEFTDEEWRPAFDENGNQITRRAIYSEEWVDVPVDKAIDFVTKLKKTAPLDVEVQLRTTGEEAQMVLHRRQVRTLTKYGSNSPYDFTTERIQIGPWVKTDQIKWNKTGMLKETRPVDWRTCVPSC